MKVAAKIKNLVTAEPQGTEGKSVEPFYINRLAEKEWAKESTEKLEKINRVCTVWASVTKKPIQSEEEYHLILKDSAMFWRSDKFNEKGFVNENHDSLSLLFSAFEEKEIKKMLRLPAGFEQVVAAVEQVNRLAINWKYFTWIDKGFQLSEYYFNRVDGKVFYHAISPIQQKRLAKAKALLEAIKGLEEVMIEEAREAGISEDRINKAKENCHYVGPLPYALRHEHAYHMEGNGIEINEKWVVSGLKQWADVIGLPKLSLKDRPPVKPFTPTVYLKYLRTDLDGGRRLYVVPKEAKEKAYFGMYREAEVKFLPGEFILDPVSNKLVPNE